VRCVGIPLNTMEMPASDSGGPSMAALFLGGDSSRFGPALGSLPPRPSRPLTVPKHRRLRRDSSEFPELRLKHLTCKTLRFKRQEHMLGPLWASPDRGGRRRGVAHEDFQHSVQPVISRCDWISQLRHQAKHRVTTTEPWEFGNRRMWKKLKRSTTPSNLQPSSRSRDQGGTVCVVNCSG
jgi:hypothetical protein